MTHFWALSTFFFLTLGISDLAQAIEFPYSFNKEYSLQGLPKNQLDIVENINEVTVPGDFYLSIDTGADKSLRLDISVNGKKILFENQIRDRALFPIQLSESNTIRIKAKGNDLSRFTLKILDVELFENIRAPEVFKGKLIPKTSTLNFNIPRPGRHLMIIKGSRLGLLASILSEVELNGERVDLVGNFLDFSKNWRVVKEVDLGTSNSFKARVFGGASDTLEVTFLRPIKMPGEFEPSLGSIEILNLSQNSFNHTSTQIELRANGTTFLPEPATVTVYNNQVRLEGFEAVVAGDRLYLKGVLVEGINNIEINAFDSSRDRLSIEGTYFAGSSELRVYAIDEKDNWLRNHTAQVHFENFDLPFDAKSNAQGEFAVFQNMPRGIAYITVQTPNAFNTSITDIANSYQEEFVQISPYPALADNSNNEFENGLEGWVTTGDVELVPHEEDAEEIAIQSYSPSRFTALAEPEIVDLDLKVNATKPTVRYVGPNRTPTYGSPYTGSATRTIKVPPGTRTIRVKMKSTTSAARVTLGSGTMNLLNRGITGLDGWEYIQFDATEEMAELTFKVSVWSNRNTPVQSVIIDAVKFSGFAITHAALADISDSALAAISADAQNPYFGGNTWLKGKIGFHWGVNDGVKDVSIEFIQRGKIAAKAKLSDFGKSQLTAVDPSAEGVRINSIGTPNPLFVLDNNEAGKLKPQNGLHVKARLRVDTKVGNVLYEDIIIPERPKNFLPILVRYKGNNRYPPDDRNNDWGGDDWAKPRVANALLNLTKASLDLGTPGFMIGDISNMNGGKFEPHKGHSIGIEADCKVVGFPTANDVKKGARPGGVAARNLLALLRKASPEEVEKIKEIYVGYRGPNPNSNFAGDPFYLAITGQLIHGRPATTLITPDPDGGHLDHFHIVFRYSGNED